MLADHKWESPRAFELGWEPLAPMNVTASATHQGKLCSLRPFTDIL